MEPIQRKKVGSVSIIAQDLELTKSLQMKHLNKLKILGINENTTSSKAFSQSINETSPNYTKLLLNKLSEPNKNNPASLKLVKIN